MNPPKLPITKHQQDVVIAFMIGCIVTASLIWLATSINVQPDCPGC